MLFWMGCIWMGCSSDGEKKKTDDTDPEELNLQDTEIEEHLEASIYEELSTGKALTRVSMALRGIRPNKHDLIQVINDPDKLSFYAHEYVESDEFGETIRDMFAEILLLRDGRNYAAKDEMIDFNEMQRQLALSEEPLALIERVINEDMPFTKIVTADWSVIDHVAATMWHPDSHNYPNGSTGEQLIIYQDGRPTAGIITTNSMLARYPSNGSNHHRARADMLSNLFLCEPFSGRDIPLSEASDVNLSDGAEVATALYENPACVACHQALDPIAAHFWGFRRHLNPEDIGVTYQVNNGGYEECDELDSANCYPLNMWSPNGMYPGAFGPTDKYEDLGLRAPNYWGEPTSSMTDVGELIAEDERFSLCMATRISSYLTQRDMNEIPHSEAADLQKFFIESDYNAKALALEIVTSEAFLAKKKTWNLQTDINIPEDFYDGFPGIQVVRPEQLYRMIEGLTGLEWRVYRYCETDCSNGDDDDDDGLTDCADPDCRFNGSEQVCESTGDCQTYGRFNLLDDDEYGYRGMSGGVDGKYVTRPTFLPGPLKLLSMAALAEDAAGHVVESDFSLDPADRKLLVEVESDETDEELIRQQIVTLYLRLHGLQVASDSDEVEQAYGLFTVAYNPNSPNADIAAIPSAWKLLIAGMLQAPDILFY